MTYIVKELEKKNLESITKIKNWTRNCPICNSELIYKNYSNFFNSNKNNRVCINCHNKRQKKHKNSDLWVRSCPICNKILKYKYERSFKYAFKYNNKCKECQDNQRKIKIEFRHCIVCNNKFETLPKNKKRFCSLKCHYNSGLQKHPRKTRPCKQCKKTIYYLDWETKHHPKIFCSTTCNYSYQISNGFKTKTKPELKMESILNSLFDNVKYGYELCGKFYDFYIPEKHLLIEVDGIYWHGKGLKRCNMSRLQIKNIKNDRIKTQIARLNGYSLWRVWETNINKEYVSKYFHLS